MNGRFGTYLEVGLIVILVLAAFAAAIFALDGTIRDHVENASVHHVQAVDAHSGD